MGEERTLTLPLAPHAYYALAHARAARTDRQATKTPEEGTLAIKHCLFTAGPEASGWYLGSDAVRSPLHYMRNPGEPPFDGVQPF